MFLIKFHMLMHVSKMSLVATRCFPFLIKQVKLEIHNGNKISSVEQSVQRMLKNQEQLSEVRHAVSGSSSRAFSLEAAA